MNIIDKHFCFFSRDLPTPRTAGKPVPLQIAALCFLPFPLTFVRTHTLYIIPVIPTASII